jgi:hypothetical protein
MAIRVSLIVEDGIIALLHKKGWDLASLDPMLPPYQTWPQLVSEAKGGFNGVYTDSLIATLSSKKVEYELHLWLRNLPGDLLTLASLGTNGEESLQTAEYATHKIGERLVEELTKNTRHERDARSLVESIPRLFK